MGGEQPFVKSLLKPEFFLSNGVLLFLDPGDPLLGAFMRDLSLLRVDFGSLSSFDGVFNRFGIDGMDGNIDKLTFSGLLVCSHWPLLSYV